MADSNVFSDKDLEDIKERVLKINNTYGILDKSLLQLDNAIKSGTANQRAAFSLYSQQDVLRSRIQKGVTEELHRYTEGLKTGNVDFIEVRTALNEMREEALKVAGDNEELRAKIEQDFKSKENGLRLQNAYNQTLGKAINVASTVVGGLVASYQSSTSGLEAALNNAKVGLDLLVLGAKGVASLFKGIPVVGEGINAAAEKVSEGAQKLMPILNAEVKKMADSFKTASNSGLIFADGISGLKNAAGEAGLTTGIFADAIKQNSEAVSIFGGNVTAGAKKIGQITKLIDTGSLQKLGFTLDEIPGLIAQTGARLRRSGITGDAEVAQATMDYAKNLRTIADLTGKDAKTLMDKQDVAEQDLAYQQFLADKTPEQANAIRQQMMALPESVQAMAKEMMISGGQLTSDTTNLTAQQIPAYKAMADAAYAAANSGTASAQMGIKILQDNAAAAEAQTKSIKDFALAASVLNDGLKPVADGIASDRALLLRALDPTKLNQMMSDIENAAKTPDPKTENLAELERIGMRQQVTMQDAIVNSLGDYMSVLIKLNKVTELAVQGFSATAKAVMGNGEQFSDLEKKLAVASAENKSLGTERTGLFGLGNSEQQKAANDLVRMTSDQVQQLAKINNTTVDAIAKTAGFANTQKLDEARTQQQEQDIATMNAALGAGGAEGGIFSGPSSGYLAKLHGTEAVLPESLTEILMNNATNTSDENNSGAASLLNNANLIGLGGNSDSLLEMLNRKMDDLIQATREVAGHTELTSHRIA